MYDLAPDAVGWQEVNHDADLAAIERVMGRGCAHFHTDLSVPISVDLDRWEVLDAGRHRTHGGRKRVTRARWVTWVIARNRATGEDVAFVNTHFISGAWNSKPKLAKAWRRLRWTEHETEMATLIRTLVADEYVVIFGGDYNRLHVKRIHPDAVWLDDRGIDKIGIIGEHQLLEPARRIRTPSDHDARCVDVEV